VFNKIDVVLADLNVQGYNGVEIKKTENEKI
jgi:hypothetical protein